VETAAACIAYIKTKNKERGLMPVKSNSFTPSALFSFITKAASFAAYTLVALFTGNASLAAGLRSST
jgi:hypothetical protein